MVFKKSVKKNRPALWVTLALLLFQTTPVSAVLVSSTVFNGNTFNLMTDNSGNEWLSLLATDGLSYFTVNSNIDNAVGDFANYHFATQSDVLALFNEYGAPDIDAGQTPANVPFAMTFQNDFGFTGADTGGGALSWGYTSDIQPGFPSIHVSPLVNLDIGGGGNPKASFATDLNVNIFFGADPFDRGSWLIRNSVSAVSEPASGAMWLIVSGLFGLMHVARRRSTR